MKGAFSTLLNSWGMDTPPEVIWGLNEALKWAKERGFQTDKEFEEEESEEYHNDNLAKDLGDFFETL